MKRRVVSAMLATMMLFSNATPVLAAGVAGNANNNGGNVDVSAAVESPVYKISVPTTLDFYIDPFQQLAAGQITSDDFVIINKSNVALKVGATVTVEGKDSTVTLKNAATDVTETTTDKLAYIEAEIPSEVVETYAAGAAFVQSDDFATEYATMYKGTVGTDTKYYTTTSSSAVDDEEGVATEMVETTGASGTYATSKKVAIDTTNGTDLTFALDKANYIDVYTNYNDTTKAGVAFKDVAADGKGTAVFRFNGKVNTTAAWANGDITGRIAYTFTGLTPELYTTNAAKVGTDAHAYVVPAPADAAPSIETTSWTMSAGTAVEIPVNLGSGDLAADGIASIKFTNLSGAEKTLGSEYFTFENDTLTFTSAYIDMMLDGGVTSRTFVITFNDDAETPVTVTLATN